MASSRPGRLLALLALLAGCAPEAPDHDWLRGPFKGQAGDDRSWAEPGFDDREWPLVDARLLPGSELPGWSGIGWFRVWVEISPVSVGRPLPLYGRFVGAAEVFVAGQRQVRTADPDEVLAGGATPVDFDAGTPRWVTFPQAGRQLVAVRFASSEVAAMQRIGFPGGFELALGEPLASRSPGGRGWARAAFIGATVALALLHLLLFLFHRHRTENLHFALAALGIATIMASQEALQLAATTTQVLLAVSAFSAAIVLSSVLLLRFYYAVFFPRLPRVYAPLLAVAIGLAVLAWTLPRPVHYAFAALVCLEQARVLAAAVLRRVTGAWILGIGGVLWVVSGLLEMLGDLGVLPELPGAYLHGFVALLASISIYLARGIARDRSELAERLVEIEALSANERRAMERYRTIFETTGTGTITFGDDAIISLANEEWSQLTGYSRQEIEGRMTWMEFFSAASLEKMKRYHALRSEDPDAAPRTYEAELRDRRGRVHDGVVTISLVPGTTERVGSFLDLSDLKRAHRQMFRADKLAALGQISAGVAHEINNPNNFIHFNLPILRKYVDAARPLIERGLEQEPGKKLLNMSGDDFLEDLFKLIENMEHGSQRITAIVSNLRTYIRSGEEAEMKIGSIAKVVEQVMALAGQQVEKQVGTLEVSVAENLPPVRMNSGKIEQVLINLLINAGQAADKAASWVKLSVRALDGGSAVEIVVEDNGTGIPAESLEQIFEPFFTTKGRESGTGLGLSISQQIVEEHGGRIEVSSEVGQGSCFTVRLPAAG